MIYEPMIIPPVFSGLPVKAFFTTKASGCDKDAVSKIAGIASNNIYLPVQKHTDKVLVLDYDLDPKVADAVVTDRKRILIGVQTADCVPVLLYDTKRRIAGAVHAGWRGTAAEILKKTIRTMADRYFSSPADVLIAIGTGIRWCCYNVGYEVIEAVERVTSSELYGDCPRFTDADRRRRIGTVPAPKSKDYIIKKGEKYCLDLPTANKYQAISSGVPADNIWMSDECTFCLPEKYYSYRYAKGATGRQFGFIGIV